MSSSENINKLTKSKSAKPSDRPKKSPNGSLVARAILSLEIELKDLPPQTVKRLRATFPDLPKKMSIRTVLVLVQAVKAIGGDKQALAALIKYSHALPDHGSHDDAKDQQPGNTNCN